MTGLASPLLVVVFVRRARRPRGWRGSRCRRRPTALDARLGLGEELGGLLLLSVAGSLPELAITVSAAAGGHLGLAAGNLIGGIAVQTMVLVICDFAVGRERPLTFLVGALSPVLEALLVTLVVSGVLMGALLPSTTAIGGVVSPASIGIVVVWTVGVYVINTVRKSPRWKISMEGAQPGRRHRRERPCRPSRIRSPSARRRRWRRSSAARAPSSLTAGVGLEMSGNTLADRAGVNGVIFGATVLALATALPGDQLRRSPRFGSATTRSRSATSSAATRSSSASSCSPTWSPARRCCRRPAT